MMMVLELALKGINKSDLKIINSSYIFNFNLTSLTLHINASHVYSVSFPPCPLSAAARAPMITVLRDSAVFCLESCFLLFSVPYVELLQPDAPRQHIRPPHDVDPRNLLSYNLTCLPV